jgi:molecular chaperone GrpE
MDKKPENDQNEQKVEAQAPEVEIIKNVDYKEKFIRLTADFQNLQRRMAQERANWMHLAQVGILKELLEIVDNFDRALESSPVLPDNSDATAWIEGAGLISQSLHKLLDKFKVQETPQAINFDPELHEAVMRVASDDHESGAVVQVLQKGYTVNGKLLRAAKVSVAE